MTVYVVRRFATPLGHGMNEVLGVFSDGAAARKAGVAFQTDYWHVAVQEFGLDEIPWRFRSPPTHAPGTNPVSPGSAGE